MSGRKSQHKGRNGELELCRIFHDYGIPAKPGRAVSFDCTPDVIGVPGIHPEVKRVERLNVPVAMEQAVRDSEKFRDGVPTLLHRRNRSMWLATMRLSDWMRLYLSSEVCDKTDNRA